MTGHICPECGGEQSARPGPGAGTDPGSTGPRCACGVRTAQLPGEELRAARSAEMAAAEDFDPLRIRPYVTLSSDTAPEHGTPPAATTMPLFMAGATGGAVGGAATGAAGPWPGADAADETRRRTAAAYAGSGPEPVQPRRRRPFAVLAAGAAVVAVVGTAAFAGGLFDRDDSREEALPEVTASVPDATDGPADTVSESPSASASPTPSRSASASPSSSPSASASRSPSASPSSTAPATPSPSASATQAPDKTSAPPAQIAGPTLRRGDEGPEVAELQRRLQEIWVYREPDNGDYTERVERAVREFQSWVSVQNDPPGVYGPETRRALEAQTTGEGRRS